MNNNFDITKMFKKIDVLDKGYIFLIDGMVSDPRLKVVNAARVSFNKESQEYSDKDEKLVKYLYQHGHLSTYRHSAFTFRIKAPLFVFRQWWKYQISSSWTEEALGDDIIITDTSWNEASGRYVNFEPQFYIPQIARAQSKDNKQGSSDEEIKYINGYTPQELIEKTSLECYETYQTLIKGGVAKELARSILPQNIYSECVWTCSLQTIIHFFNQRLKKDAQFEIREYAKAMHTLLDDIKVLFENESI